MKRWRVFCAVTVWEKRGWVALEFRGVSTRELVQSASILSSFKGHTSIRDPRPKQESLNLHLFFAHDEHANRPFHQHRGRESTIDTVGGITGFPGTIWDMVTKAHDGMDHDEPSYPATDGDSVERGRFMGRLSILSSGWGRQGVGAIYVWRRCSTWGHVSESLEMENP
jgi:hypothetical protein